jgi:hypothetical protein
MSASNGREPNSPQGGNDERARRSGNIYLLVAAALFIVAGLWLIDAMIAARKADECLSAGRRNCAATDIPLQR